jgi:hypothetical protein
VIARRIQELYLAGRKAEAAADVPDGLAAGVSLIASWPAVASAPTQRRDEPASTGSSAAVT